MSAQRVLDIGGRDHQNTPDPVGRPADEPDPAASVGNGQVSGVVPAVVVIRQYVGFSAVTSVVARHTLAPRTNSRAGFRADLRAAVAPQVGLQRRVRAPHAVQGPVRRIGG
jgi:hypothetical protein